MTSDCRNDCLEPLIFPKRPSNRPGLSRVSYRIGTYSDIREFLLRNLNKDVTLAPWTHRGSDDPGLALLEGASILGDILTFYQELYANEAYLRTAQSRESIADLVRLLGYRLSPGLGGRGAFAFEISGDASVVIPKGFPITAQVTGLEQQADFQTADEAVAYPWLSKFNLYRPLSAPNVTQSTAEFYIFSPDPFVNPITLEPGDRLIIGDAYPAGNPTRLINGEIVIIDRVRELHGRKLYKIKGSLSRPNSVSEVAAYKVGRSFRHFGHNAPPKVTVVSDGSASQNSITYTRYLNAATSADVDPDLAKEQFPLDVKVDDLPRGVDLVCRSVMRRMSNNVTYYTVIELTMIRRIADVRQGAYTWGALTGQSTLLVLDSELTTTTNPAVDSWYPTARTYDRIDIREIQFHETISPRLRLRAAPAPTSATAGHDVYFLGTDAQVQALKDRRLFLVGEGGEPEQAVVQSVETQSPNVADRRLLRRVTLDANLTYADFPNENPAVTVYGNLVDATQGKSEREAALGNGDSRQVFQTFKLPKAPLTYLTSTGQTPPEAPEMQIYVNDRLWKRVPAHFARGPKEEIYIVREDAKGESWVQFGDGKTGARLPSGIKNVVAKYRTGIAAFGALKEGTNANPGGRVDRLSKIRLPGEVSGGEQPESGENAREAAPGKIQSLDRLVSLRDFEMETLAIAGVSRASAAWELVDNVPAVVITALMKTGRDAEIAQVAQILAGYNRCRGPQRFPIIVHQGHLQYIYLDAGVAIDPSFREGLVIKAVEEALGVVGREGSGVDGSRGLLAAGRRRFGAKEYATRIEGAIQNVAGVRWSRVNGLGSLGTAVDPATLTLPAVPWPLSAVVGCGAENILALHGAHLKLSPVAVMALECT